MKENSSEDAQNTTCDEELEDLVSSTQNEETGPSSSSEEDSEEDYDVQNSGQSASLSKKPAIRRNLRKSIVFNEEKLKEVSQEENVENIISQESDTPSKKHKLVIESSSSSQEDYTPRKKKTTSQAKKSRTTSKKKETSSSASQGTDNLSSLDLLMKEHGLAGDTKKMFLMFYNSNRPTSITELSLTFKKKVAETCLAELEKKKLISMKLNNKTKLYMLNTSVCDYDDVKEYEQKIEEYTEKIKSLKGELSALQKDLSEIQNQPTEEEIEGRIRLLEETVLKNDENIKKIETGELYTEDEVNELKHKANAYMKILKERKKLFKHIVDILSENMNMKKKEFLEEVGIEDDA